jgi:hypothetical protein
LDAVDLTGDARLLRQLCERDLPRHEDCERHGRGGLTRSDLVGWCNADHVVPRQELRLIGLLDLNGPADGFELFGALARPDLALGEKILPRVGKARARGLLVLAPCP